MCGSQPVNDDGNKQLSLASPRRGEAKGSAAHAASPSPGAELGSSRQRAKGARGRMGGCQGPLTLQGSRARGVLPRKRGV